MPSQALEIKQKAGLLQIGNNVFLNSSGSIINGDNSFTVSSSGIVLPHSTVSQETNSSTSVTVSGSSGIITTVVLDLEANETDTFTVSNSSVTENSVVVVSAVNYTGTYGVNGIPVVSVNSIVQGGFDIVVINAHSTTSLNGSLSISFIVV